MQRGDQAWYVPHAVHARHKNASGERAWVIGRRTMRQGAHGPEEFIAELSANEVDEHLARVSRDPGARNDIVFLRPGCCWHAVVHQVNADGTVDLDINCGGNGVTLLVNGVAVDEQGKKPHTCHAVKDEVSHLDAHAFSKIDRRGEHLLAAKE